jgi:hypothetical protein
MQLKSLFSLNYESYLTAIMDTYEKSRPSIAHQRIARPPAARIHKRGYRENDLIRRRYLSRSSRPSGKIIFA